MIKESKLEERFLKLNLSHSSNHNDIRGEGQSIASLSGKAVLLISRDAIVLPALIEQLAQKGADVALISRRIPDSILERIKRFRGAGAGRLLVYQETAGEEESASELIEKISDQLGGLDIYIDLSAASANQSQLTDSGDLNAKVVSAQWPLLRAVVTEMG